MSVSNAVVKRVSSIPALQPHPSGRARWSRNTALMSAVNIPGARQPPPEALVWMIAHRWRQDLKDVGDQALMRGLDTALPIERLGLSLSYYGRRLIAGHKASVGRSPAVVLPPPVREEDACDQAGCATRPTDHMKPASSRAIAVQTTVVRLPVAVSLRYRAVRRD